MSGSPPLAGRVGLVAGAAGRFGRAVSVALAEAGAEVALACATRETGESFAIASIANELWALGRRHLTLTMDYCEPASIADALRQTLAELGPVDLLVNAADASDTAERPFDPTADSRWQRILEQRLGGTYVACRAVGEAMRDRGSGSILNLVSPASRGSAGSAMLAAAEAGILGLTRSLALEWEGRVTVNAAIVRDETAPASVAALVTLLAGAGASALTGQVFEL